VRTQPLHPAIPALLFAVLASGCIEPTWSSEGAVVLALVAPLPWEACDDPCRLEAEGEVRRLGGLAADVSSATGRVCAVPSPDDLTWSVVPSDGSRLVSVGEDEEGAVRVEALACEPGPVGAPCTPVEPGEGAHLFLVAMNEGDEASCDVLRGSDFEEGE
jgi:hypothetical protein